MGRLRPMGFIHVPMIFSRCLRMLWESVESSQSTNLIHLKNLVTMVINDSCWFPWLQKSSRMLYFIYLTLELPWPHFWKYTQLLARPSMIMSFWSGKICLVVVLLINKNNNIKQNNGSKTLQHRWSYNKILIPINIFKYLCSANAVQLLLTSMYSIFNQCESETNLNAFDLYFDYIAV